MDNSEQMKLECPHCAGHVMAVEENYLQGFDCPHCATTIAGSGARLIRMEPETLGSEVFAESKNRRYEDEGQLRHQEHEASSGSQELPHPSESPTGKLGRGGYAKIFSRRVFQSDFYSESATDEEREVLINSVPSIKSDYIQNYATWRRALLWFAAIAAAYLCTEQFFSFFGLPSDLSFFENGFLFALLVAQVGAAVSIILAAKRWNSMAVTRKWARSAYILLLLGPFIIYLVPWRFITNTSPDFFITGAITMLLPKVFGLFPGIIRACLTMKTFVPESMLPGWLALIIAPIYSLFFGVAVLAAVQGGTILWFIAFASFMVAPLVLLMSSKNLVAPLSLGLARDVVRVVRRRMGVIYLIGGIALMLATSTLIADMDLTIWDVFSVICSAATSIFLSTVVFSDLTLAFIKVAHEQELALRGKEGEARLRERLQDLSIVGMTNMLAGEDEIAKQVGERFRDVSARVKEEVKKSRK